MYHHTILLFFRYYILWKQEKTLNKKKHKLAFATRKTLILFASHTRQGVPEEAGNITRGPPEESTTFLNVTRHEPRLHLYTWFEEP